MSSTVLHAPLKQLPKYDLCAICRPSMRFSTELQMNVRLYLSE